jgi:hypothetical protein
MNAQLQWNIGASSLHRVVESEEAILRPFEIFGDCTQAHLDENRDWLVPRFQDLARQTRIGFLKENANSGRLIFPTHFPSPTGGRIERDGDSYRFVYDGER